MEIKLFCHAGNNISLTISVVALHKIQDASQDTLLTSTGLLQINTFVSLLHVCLKYIDMIIGFFNTSEKVLVEIKHVVI